MRILLLENLQLLRLRGRCLENGFRLTLYQKMDSSGEKSEENQLLSDFFAEEAREIDIFFIISG